MSGCNDAQKTEWRRLAKGVYPDQFEFVDPTETPIARGGRDSQFELVRQDAAAIRSVDAVLAHMWKESIGTAIGVSEARRAGKIVVIVDHNHIQSGFLAYFADAVAHSVEEGMTRLYALVKGQRRVEWVSKSDGTMEPFQREKLARSIRAACTSAKKNDALCAPEILPRAIERVLSPRVLRDGRVTSAALRDAVFEALADLARDVARGAEFAGIREAWTSHVDRFREGAALPNYEAQALEAYQGEDWERRISAEAALSGQCPMNTLFLCTKFEEAWAQLGHDLGALRKDNLKSDYKATNNALHAIAIAGGELQKLGAFAETSPVPQSDTRVFHLLDTARRARNAAVHDGAFGEDRARMILGAWRVLQAIRGALEAHPEVRRRKPVRKARQR